MNTGNKISSMNNVFVLLSAAVLCTAALIGSCTLTSINGPNGVTTHDLEFYKSKEAYTINHPFPQAGIISTFGLRPDAYSQQAINTECQKAFADWVKYWITDTGCAPGSVRPHVGPGPGLLFYSEPYGTISEFVGWGLMMCVLMDNEQNRTKNLFNSLNNFRKAYLNEYGLMMSTINFNKPMDEWNRDAATEADENMAMALLLAHYQWGSGGVTNYLAEATELINNISAHLVERPAYVLKPAVKWGGSGCLDPCYYDSIYYPLWYNLTKDATWIKLDDHFRFLVTYFCDKYGTGLLPEWCKADGTSTPIGGNGLGDNSYIFSWDAHQISTKWAIHYAWYGTGKTEIFAGAAKMLAAWVRKQANGDLGSLVNSYTLDGKPIGQYSHVPVIGGALALSGIVSAEYQDMVNEAYKDLLTVDPKPGYNWAAASWKVVQLLVYSGNFVNFTDLD